MTELEMGLQLMIYGISGVFGVLVLFYLIIAGLTTVFPYKEV